MGLAEDITIDTTEIQRVLTELQRIAFRLDGKQLQPDLSRRSDPEQAAISRDLLQATDLAQVVGGEFSMLYWALKGRVDPRFS